MTASKRQHVIPMMLQKRFTNPDGLLWSWSERRGLAPNPIGPINLFVESHIYSFVDGEGVRSDSLERMFSLLEGAASPILDKLIVAARKHFFPALTASEVEIIFDFLFNQYQRVPELFREFQPSNLGLDNTLAQAEADGLEITDETKRWYAGEKNEQRISRNIVLAAIGSFSGQFYDALRRRGLRLLLITRSDRSFVLGSFPFARFGDPKGNDLGNPDAELWIPIAPDVLLGSMGPPFQGMIKFTDSDKAIRKVNTAIAGRSLAVASASRDLVVSLTRHRKLTTRGNGPLS